MKTYTVKIENGAGTILTSAVAEFVDDYLTDEPLQTHIAPEEIEGQERYEVDRGEPKGSTVPPTYAWRIKDGLYEMARVKKPKFNKDWPNNSMIKYQEALAAYRPWRVVKKLK